MLAALASSSRLPVGWVAEPKMDGYRTLVGKWVEAGVVRIRSRHGTDMTPGFPEITEALGAVPDSAGDFLLDGELVIWSGGRLDFDRLQPRLGAGAALARRLAAAEPASFVAFDLLYADGASLMSQPYRARRARLEALFTDYGLRSPLELMPSSTDPGDLAAWLGPWTRVGIEGVLFKDPDQPYVPGRRGWLKYKVRTTTEAVIGAVVGNPGQPDSLLLGRYDHHGRLRYVGRSSRLRPGPARTVAGLLTLAGPGHPWTGRVFTSRWQRTPPPGAITLVVPEVVVEISVDTALEPGGAFRHAVRFERVRPELRPEQVRLLELRAGNDGEGSEREL